MTHSHVRHNDKVISLDIGSTFTKAALFNVGPETLVHEKTAMVPTHPASLPDSVYQVLKCFGCLEVKNQKPPYPVYFSSSAKGGLHIIAVGIVPNLTLKAARITAMSAGAKVTQAYGNKLTLDNIRQIQQLCPDIILLCGGTDGGNETHVRHNAGLLAGLQIRPEIIYAGNKVMRDEVSAILSQFSLYYADNILPELDHISPDSARQTIQDVFLKHIITGKGLSDIVQLASREPLPTPLAVMELVEAISSHRTDWSDFCVVDMGGATTDFYSCCEGHPGEGGVLYRGLMEPRIKRTVEGELGMRINAASVLLAGSGILQNLKNTDELMAIQDYAYKVMDQTSYVPDNPIEKSYDRMIADICITQAAERHVGHRKRIFTGSGESFIQTGKDLRSVSKIVFTGGFLSQCADEGLAMLLVSRWKQPRQSKSEYIYLYPQKYSIYQDKSYLLPLLGNLVRDYPIQVVHAAINSLTDLPIPTKNTMENIWS